MNTINYAGRVLTVPDWPGEDHRGSYFMREGITGRGSIGYGRASHNPKQGQGIQDSADEQARQYREFCREWGTRDLGTYLDPSASAGISAAKARELFGQAIERVQTDKQVQVVWVLSSSRMSRGDVGFDEIAATLIEQGVLWAIGDQLYNPAELQDREDLFQKLAADRGATVAPRIASRNGQRRALADGRPLHRPPYGLRRDRDRRPVWDVPDYRHPEGQPAPADVVREIFRRAAAGDTLNGIATDLETRQVYVPSVTTAAGWAGAAARPFMWNPAAVRYIAANPVYTGRRRAGGEVRDDIKAHIDPLVSEDVFRAAQRALARNRGPGSQLPRNSMLARTALCGVCGTPLTTSSGKRRKDGTSPRIYACRTRGHVAIGQDWLDEYVNRHMIQWLASPETAKQLATHHGEDDRADAEAAEAEAEAIQAEIDELLAEAQHPAGQGSARLIRTQMSHLDKRLAEVNERARPSSLNPLLASVLGEDAADKWLALPPADRGKVIRMTAQVTVGRLPAGAAPRWDSAASTARVGWAWAMRNPETGELIDGGLLPTAPAPAQPYVPAKQERGERITGWLATQDGPRTTAQIATALGEHVFNIREALPALLEAGRVTRQHGIGANGGPNAWFYRTAS